MNGDPVPIDPAKAVEAGYWFGMIDAIRDVYRMTFKDIKPSTFSSLPSGSTCDDDLSSKIAESSPERLDLADLVIFFNILLPEISTIDLIF